MLSAAGSALAASLSGVDAPALVAAADLIVTGRATDMESQQYSLYPSESIAIAVDRVLKGAPTKQVKVRLDLSDPAAAIVANGQYGVFFLHRGPVGLYVAVDPQHPGFAVTRAATGANGGGDPLHAVAAELAGSLLSGNGAGDRYADQETASALKSIPIDIAGESLRTVAESNQASAKLWAINCLLAMDQSDDADQGQAHYVAALARFLKRPDPQLGFTTDMLIHAIQTYVRSPQAVPALAALLTSENVGVRRGAASALSDIASDDVIAPLGKIALNDSDKQVRYFAVVGLASATGVEIPMEGDFEADESQIVKFWHGWVAANLQ
jgi:hypothetical protein